MKEWRLGCWSLLQDWLNIRWTSGWPEICSWRLRSESHTDLWETEFPLYLTDTADVIQSGCLPGQQCLPAIGEMYLDVASVCQLVWPLDSVCVTVQEKSERGSCLPTADPDLGNSSWKESRGSVKRTLKTSTETVCESAEIIFMINYFKSHLIIKKIMKQYLTWGRAVVLNIVTGVMRS